MAAGRIVDGVDLLSAQNRIHSIEHREERLQAIARAYAAMPDGTLVVSPDNRSRKDLNAAIRAELREAGQLGPDTYQLPVLINRQDVTGEDRGVASSYHVGDSVRYLRGSEAVGLEAKGYATVINVDSEQNQITVKKSDGQAVTYDPGRLKGVSIYEPEMRSFAEGDRVQFTAPWKDKAVGNRDLGTITYLDIHGNVRVQLDDSQRTVTWNLRENQHLDYAYAMTSHSSQGATVDQVFIHVDTAGLRIVTMAALATGNLNPARTVYQQPDLRSTQLLNVVEACLHRCASEWIFLRELRVGTGFHGNAAQRLDALALNCLPHTSMRRVCYEVKTSRADFLCEIKQPLKRRVGLRYSNEFYFVTPAGLLRTSELPIECGLVEIGTFTQEECLVAHTESGPLVHFEPNHGAYCRVTVPAPGRETPGPTWQFVAGMLRNQQKVFQGRPPKAPNQQRLPFSD